MLKIDSFRSRLNEVAHKRLTLDSLQPRLRLDAEVGLEEISLGCVQALEQMRPAGNGNPTVQLFVRNLNHRKPLQRIGKEKEHVKMWVTDGVTTHEAVWWGAGKGSLPVGNFDLAFVPLANEFNGRRQVQLKVLDWRGAQEAMLV